MFKKIILILIFTISLCELIHSQNEVKKWYFGANAAIDFMSGAPINVLGSQLNHIEGSSSMSDAAGNLLFYTDGITVWNRNHTPMPNGTGLLGGVSSTQAALIVKQPGNANIYYIFTTSAWGAGSSNYSIVDMTLSAGFGDVTTKNTQMLAMCSEKLAATKHCNGTDIWILNHENSGNKYHAFLLTATGLNPSIQSSIGQNYSSNQDYGGQLKFSPNGTKLCAGITGKKLFELFDFDKTTGIISNQIVLGTNINVAYGVEFSPDNSKVYGFNTDIPGGQITLRQWDLCATSPAAIIASNTIIASPIAPNAMEAGSLQLATDGKIYVARFVNMLGVINNPNAAGLACNYNNTGFSVAPNSSQDGLPNFVSNYFDLNDTLALISSTNTTACQNNGSAIVSIKNSCSGAPYTYTWSNSTTTGPTSDIADTLNNLPAGTYNVIVADASCKKDTLYFTITGSSSISVSQNINICTGNNYTLPGGTVVNTAGTYIDTLLSVNGCDSIITTVLSVVNSITISQNITICSGESYTLPGGNVATVTGTYIDTLITTGGCDSIVTTTLTVNTNPNATVSADITIAIGSNTTLSATGGGTYNWFPSTGLSSTTDSIVIATPSQTTTYCVVITNIYGCSDTACVTVTVDAPCPEEKNLALPNAFSPNNDDVNDEFCLKGWVPCVESFEIKIFDRWGEKVFESKDPNFCWDGNYKGTIMDAQTFIYYLKAKFIHIDGAVNKKGNIALIR